MHMDVLFCEKAKRFVPGGAENQSLLAITTADYTWLGFLLGLQRRLFSCSASSSAATQWNQTLEGPKCLVKSDASKISLSSCFNVIILPDFMNQTFICSRSGSREDWRPLRQSLFGLHLQQRRRSINNLSHHFVDAQPCRNQLELEPAGGEKIWVCAVTGAG